MKLIWYEAYEACSSLTSIVILATFLYYGRRLGLWDHRALCVSAFKPVDRFHETYYQRYAISIKKPYVIIYNNRT
jgi:hypothetical protein